MGLLLQGFSLGHDRYFSRSPCLPVGSTRRSLTLGCSQDAQPSSRRLFPRRVRTRWPGPGRIPNRRQAPFPSWISILFRACARVQLACALIAKPPFTPFGRVTSLSTGAPRSLVRTGEQVLLGTCSSHEVSYLLVEHAPSAALRYNRKDRKRTAPADAVRTSASAIGFPPALRSPASWPTPRTRVASDGRTARSHKGCAAADPGPAARRADRSATIGHLIRCQYLSSKDRCLLWRPSDSNRWTAYSPPRGFLDSFTKARGRPVSSPRAPGTPRFSTIRTSREWATHTPTEMWKGCLEPSEALAAKGLAELGRRGQVVGTRVPNCLHRVFPELSTMARGTPKWARETPWRPPS